MKNDYIFFIFVFYQKLSEDLLDNLFNPLTKSYITCQFLMI